MSLHSGFRQLNHAPAVLGWRVGSAPDSRDLNEALLTFQDSAPKDPWCSPSAACDVQLFLMECPSTPHETQPSLVVVSVTFGSFAACSLCWTTSRVQSCSSSCYIRLPSPRAKEDKPSPGIPSHSWYLNSHYSQQKDRARFGCPYTWHWCLWNALTNCLNGMRCLTVGNWIDCN